jgi:hypothetical protein
LRFTPTPTAQESIAGHAIWRRSIQPVFRIARRTAPAFLKSTLDKVNREWNALYIYKTQPHRLPEVAV